MSVTDAAAGQRSPVTSGGSSADELRVITSRLMKSHVEDLTLRHTPRGSGAGYGVGCDYDNNVLLQTPLPFTADLPSAESLHTAQEG